MWRGWGRWRSWGNCWAGEWRCGGGDHESEIWKKGTFQHAEALRTEVHQTALFFFLTIGYGRVCSVSWTSLAGSLSVFILSSILRSSQCWRMQVMQIAFLIISPFPCFDVIDLFAAGFCLLVVVFNDGTLLECVWFFSDKMKVRSWTSTMYFMNSGYKCWGMCVCACACVCKREREN